MQPTRQKRHSTAVPPAVTGSAGKKAKITPPVTPPSSPKPSQLAADESDDTLSENADQSEQPDLEMEEPATPASPVTATPTEEDDQHTTLEGHYCKDVTPFTHEAEVRKRSRFVIFTDKHHTDRSTPSADKTKHELNALTFHQYLEWWLAHPSTVNQRKHMFSDEQYTLLLDWLLSQKRIVDYATEHTLTKPVTAWLYRASADSTYKYSMMEYHGATAKDITIGPVLVTFKEPDGSSYLKFNRRPAKATTDLTEGKVRRCVPFSQIEVVLEFCHTGALGKTMHFGQDTTYKRYVRHFDGISRDMIREYVKKCAICQQKPRKKNKAKLVPILADQLYERVQIDLIDYSNKPSQGYVWILHAVDHYSKSHWAFPMPNKRSATVAACLDLLFQQTGPIKYLQCDNGTEFQDEVIELLNAWCIQPQLNSSARHPQSQGLVERYNGCLKTLLDKWMAQEKSDDWAVPLSRIVYQLNCVAPRTTKQIPYELKNSKKPPEWEGLKFVDPLTDDSLTTAFASLQVDDSEHISPVQQSSGGTTRVDVLAQVAEQQSDAFLCSRPPSPDSRPPLSQSRPLVSELWPPVRETRPPTREPRPPFQNKRLPQQSRPPYTIDAPDLALRAVTNYDDTLDVPVGRAWPLNSTMDGELNIGGLEFVRYGCDGYGRCLFASFYNATGEITNRTIKRQQDRLIEYDKRRLQYRQKWERLSEPEHKAVRDKLIEMMYHLGNSGQDYRGSTPAEIAGLPAGSPAVVAYRRRQVWDNLGAALAEPERSLGWEMLAWLATDNNLNCLLYCYYTASNELGAGTNAAAQKWADAVKSGTDAAVRKLMKVKENGGAFLDVSAGTTCTVVPVRLVQDWPIVVIYQRSSTGQITEAAGTYELNLGDKGPGKSQAAAEKLQVIPLLESGHYETIMLKTESGQYTGLFEVNKAPTQSAHRLLLTLLQRELTNRNAAMASMVMSAVHDSGSTVIEYKLLDAVAVLVPGSAPKKGDTKTTLPGLVVDIKQHEIGEGKSTVVHKSYRVWTPYGLLKKILTVDRLATLSINNFPELLDFRDNKLSPEERLPIDNPQHQSPMNGTLANVKRIKVSDAHANYKKTFKKGAGKKKRKKSTADRITAIAGDTAIAAGLADNISALSLSTVTNQPTPVAPSQSDDVQKGSHIVRIVGVNRANNKYKVQWSEPVGDPSMTFERKAWMEKKYPELVAEYSSVVIE